MCSYCALRAKTTETYCAAEVGTRACGPTAFTDSAVPDVVQLRACQNPPSLITDSTGHPTSVEQPFDGQVDCGFFQNKGDVSQRNRT